MWFFRFLYNTYACRKASIRNVREKFPSVRTVSYDTGGRKRKFAHMSNEKFPKDLHNSQIISRFAGYKNHII